MGSVALKAVSKKGKNTLAQISYTSVLDIPISLLLENAQQPLKATAGEKKAYLFVNVATK